MRRHAPLPLPIFVHLRGPRLGPSLLPLIVRLTATLPNRLEQTCRLLWTQFLLRCRLLSGRWRVLLRGVLRLLPLLALRLGCGGLLLLTLLGSWGWRLLWRSMLLALLLLALLLAILLSLLLILLLLVLGLPLLLLRFAVVAPVAVCAVTDGRVPDCNARPAAADQRPGYHDNRSSPSASGAWLPGAAAGFVRPAGTRHCPGCI